MVEQEGQIASERADRISVDTAMPVSAPYSRADSGVQGRGLNLPEDQYVTVKPKNPIGKSRGGSIDIDMDTDHKSSSSVLFPAADNDTIMVEQEGQIASERADRISVDSVRTVELLGYVAVDGVHLRRLDLTEDQYVTVKPKNPIGKSREIEKIPTAEAVCRVCYVKFQENMIQTHCRCQSITMIHESCETKWLEMNGNGKCDRCEQKIQNIHITVSTAPQTINEKHESKPTHNRFLCSCFRF